MRSRALRVLLSSDEPSVRWKARVRVLGEDPGSLAIRRLQGQVRRSERVRLLLSGHRQTRPSVYAKWVGAHWVLAALADLGYPAGDPDLAPLRDEVLGAWLHPRYFREHPSARQRDQAVPVLQGRARRCASQQGSALLSIVRLGLDDGRGAQLVERLVHWQWPDGGWNCDVRPNAASSSVHETLLPLRGLAAYARSHDDASARDAAARAADVLLCRRLVFGRSDGRLIDRNWARLHYPPYWHYDVLAGLKGLGEAGLVGDPRCETALDLLQGMELPEGGWPAHDRYYATDASARYHRDHVDWGGSGTRRVNEWVTADVLAVLAAAGRL
jgi:hypothetical protein